MPKLTKLETFFILLLVFFVFVFIGLKKKYGIYGDILERVGVVKPQSLTDKLSMVFDLFLIGIGVKS